MKQILRIGSKSICLLIAMWLIGCQSENSSGGDSQWTEIIIKLDGQMVEIVNYEDQSGWNRIFVPNDTVEAFSCSRSQLDSIHDLVYSIIKNPPVPDHFVSPELAENVSFEIINSKDIALSTRTTTSQKIEFQFIGSWKNLSEDTRGLSVILGSNVRLLK